MKSKKHTKVSLEILAILDKHRVAIEDGAGIMITLAVCGLVEKKASKTAWLTWTGDHWDMVEAFVAKQTQARASSRRKQLKVISNG